MSVSKQQRAAGRLGPQKFAGPSTAEADTFFSGHATWEDLTAWSSAVGPGADQARARRLAACHAQYAPRTEWERWLIEQLAAMSLELGRISIIEQQLRNMAALRAGSDLWDVDRLVEVETLGARLARQPARVVAQLHQTPHGCDWLIQRWAVLARIAAASGWNDEQTQLAHHLLGAPSAGQAGPVDLPSVADEPIADPGALARRQIDRLETIREFAVVADESARAAVKAGWSDVPNRELASLRRHEQSTRRYLLWIMAQMQAVGLHAIPRSDEATAPPPKAAPAPVPLPVQPEPSTPAAAPHCAVRNEPTPTSEHDETKPSAPATPAAPIPVAAPASPRKRPDLAKIAKRDRKARRKQGQRRSSH